MNQDNIEMNDDLLKTELYIKQILYLMTANNNFTVNGDIESLDSENNNNGHIVYVYENLANGNMSMLFKIYKQFGYFTIVYFDKVVNVNTVETTRDFLYNTIDVLSRNYKSFISYKLLQILNDVDDTFLK